MLLAIGIGANDETFAPLVGSKQMSINHAVIMGGVIVVFGAVILGFNVAKTVGTGIVDAEQIVFGVNDILVILFSVSIALILGSWKGLPLSTTHAMVGSTIATALIISGGDTSVVILATVYKILLSWVVSPVIGFVGSFFVMKGILWVKKTYIKGLDDVDFLEISFSRILIIAVIVTAFSRGGNDVSNAVAPILPLYIEMATDQGVDIIKRIPLLLAGICMAIGLALIGRRVLATLGNDVVELSPTTALSVQVSTALVTFVAAASGVPISGTHVLVAAFIGTGIAAKSKINKSTVNKIAVSAVGTPFFSGLITLIVYTIFQWFV
jgi:PiT family inorganic phosphate transporter